MTNLEKYGNDLKAALAAYNGEMDARHRLCVVGLPFEEWVEEDEGDTARLVEEAEAAEKAAQKRREEAAKAVEAEKEYIRNAMPKLKAHYKANGWDEANRLLGEIQRLDPKREIFDELASACNCFHSGMWSIICDDFGGVWEFYCDCKAAGCCHLWDNVEEWYEQMEGLAEYIRPFIDDAEPIVEELKAKGGQAK